MKILVINGVNLDMLGTREPEIYGGRTLDDINSDLSVIAKNMGADIAIQGRRALVTGVRELHASVVSAEDLRGGAALITAALKADGVSTIYGTKYIDRGYYKIEEILTSVGADIVRVNL